MVEYNPFQDLNPQFSYYRPTESPKVNNNIINNGLYGNISLPEDYTVIPRKSKEEKDDYEILAPVNPINWGDIQSEMASTHGEPTQSTLSTQSSNTTNYTVKQDLQGNKKRAMDFFQSKGLSPHQAAGIVGNLIIESDGLKSTIKGDGGLAYGLAQWHPDRQKGLKLLAQKKGTDISDFDTQLEYVWEELNNGYKSALNKILNAKNTKEATAAFMLHYEKPGIPHFERRLKEAELLLS